MTTERKTHFSDASIILRILFPMPWHRRRRRVCPGLPFLNGIEVTYARGRPRRWLQAAPGGEPWGFSFPFCFFPTAPFATGTGSASSKESQLSLARGLTTCGILSVFFLCVVLFLLLLCWLGWVWKNSERKPFSHTHRDLPIHRDTTAQRWEPWKGGSWIVRWVVWSVSMGRERMDFVSECG